MKGNARSEARFKYSALAEIIKRLSIHRREVVPGLSPKTPQRGWRDGGSKPEKNANDCRVTA